MAASLDGRYTRYADDLTISFPAEEPEPDQNTRSDPSTEDLIEKNSSKIRYVRGFIRHIVGEEGYRVHGRKKASVRRRHHRQLVTGLVVNDKVNLPRETRRHLRAVEHRTRMARRSVLDSSDKPFSYGGRRQPTLTPSQLEGWQALLTMIAKQATDPPE